MGTVNYLVTHVVQNIFFYVQQEKGGVNNNKMFIFWWTVSLKGAWRYLRWKGLGNTSTYHKHPLVSVAAMLSCSLFLSVQSQFDPNLSAVSFPQGSASLALLSPTQPVLQAPSHLIRQPPACQHSQSPGLSPASSPSQPPSPSLWNQRSWTVTQTYSSNSHRALSPESTPQMIKHNL